MQYLISTASKLWLERLRIHFCALAVSFARIKRHSAPPSGKSHLGFLSSQGWFPLASQEQAGPCHFQMDASSSCLSSHVHRNLSQPLTICPLSPESFPSSSYILIQQVSVWSPNQKHAFSGLIPDLLNQTLAWSPVILWTSCGSEAGQHLSTKVLVDSTF